MKTKNIFPFILNLSSENDMFFLEEADSFKMSEIAPSVYLFHTHLKPNEDKVVEIQLVKGYSFGVNLGDDYEFQVISGDSGNYKKYTSVIYRGGSRRANLFFKKNKEYEFIVIGVEPETLEKLLDGDHEYDTLLNLHGEKLLYMMNPNLEVINNLSKLLKTERRSLSQMELLSHIYMILNLLIDQFIYDKANQDKKIYPLNKWEIDEITKITDKIREFPEREYSLSEISKQTGVTIPNLQYGFKEMHGMTFALYVREMRLLKAAQLIRKSGFNISETVKQVGLFSRSYFSRIFKDRFGLSPMEYKQKFTR